MFFLMKSHWRELDEFKRARQCQTQQKKILLVLYEASSRHFTKSVIRGELLRYAYLKVNLIGACYTKMLMVVASDKLRG